MNKLGHVYVNLCERSFLSKHVRKNKVPLIADFLFCTMSAPAAISVITKHNHGRAHTHQDGSLPSTSRHNPSLRDEIQYRTYYY